jgi:hypothetical protein
MFLKVVINLLLGAAPLESPAVFVDISPSALEGEGKQFYNLLRLLQALSLSKQGLFPKFRLVPLQTSMN